MKGLINLNKQTGITSAQCVRELKGILGKKVKIGYFGTLDPLAEGVLPISLGSYSRLSDIFMEKEKIYTAQLEFGKKSLSFDTESDIEIIKNAYTPLESEINEKLKDFAGDITLPVSAYSSKKINGQRAYKLARSNQLKEAGNSRMFVHSINLLKYSYPNAMINVNCGSGTYIRSIIHCLGLSLGTGGIMTGLLRNESCGLKIENAFTLSQIKDLAQMGDYSFIQNPTEPLSTFDTVEKVYVKPEKEALVSNGNSILSDGYKNIDKININSNSNNNKKYYILCNEKEVILAIATLNVTGDKPFKIAKVLV